MTQKDISEFTKKEFRQRLIDTQKVLLEKLGKADIAMVLGSGLQSISDGFSGLKQLSFSEIPLMPKSTVSGHKGVVLYGNSHGKSIIIWCGRIHRYEGYKTYELNIIALLSALLGCKYFIATNAAGGGYKEMDAGCIMLINSFLNRAGTCPLKFMAGEGICDESIFDCDKVLCEEDLELVRKCAKARNLNMHEGSYNWAPGPNYESHLETRLGIDHGIGAFGMSTVYELITAKKLGIRLIAISMIANKASVLCTEELTHKEVLEKMELCVPKIRSLLEELLLQITVPKEDINVFKNIAKYDDLLITCPIRYKFPPLTPAKDVVMEIIKKVNQGTAAVKYALNIMTERIDCASYFSSYEEIPYHKLPNVPVFSHSAQELVFGVGIMKATGDAVLVLHNPNLLSCYPIEAKVISEILKSSKCSFILNVIKVFHSACKSEELVVVKDTMNYTSIDTLEYSHMSFNPEMRKKINEIVMADMPGKLEVNIAGLDGPCLPSKPERVILENGGLGWVSLSHLSLIDSIRLEKIPFAIVGLCHKYDGTAVYAPKLKEYIYTKFAVDTIKVLIPEISKSILKSANIEARLRVNSSADELPTQKEINIKLEHSVENINVIASQIRNSLIGFANDLVIFPRSIGSKYLKLFSIMDSVNINYDQPAHMHSCKLYLGRKLSNNKMYLILNGLSHGNSNLEDAIPFLHIRALLVAGVNRALIVTLGYGASPNTTSGSIHYVIDHMPVCVDTPLVGMNSESWGVRFPDISKMHYNPEMLINATKMGAVKAMWTNISKPYAYDAEFGLAKFMKLDVILKQGIGEAMMMHHSHAKVTTICIIESSVNDNASTDLLEIGKRTEEEISNIVSNI